MQEPFVSVVTPVYNGEKYLAECIESVLRQSYQNWEYVIVNNCSTDNSLNIALTFADKDKRIRVLSNSKHVSVIENYNIALSHISRQSKYCKIVSADDWIYQECLSKMVKLAKAHPSVGIVGSYQISGSEVKWKGLPCDADVIAGRDVCRASFFDKLLVSGNQTSSLYLSDLILNNIPFFPHLWPYADTSAFFKYLQYYDYGFVHEILSIERIHDEQVSTKAHNLGMGSIAILDVLLQYGPLYLSETEIEMLKGNILREHWRWLGGCLLKLSGLEFWRFQISRLRDLGCPLPWSKVIRGAADEIVDEMRNPKVAFKKLLVVLKNTFR